MVHTLAPKNGAALHGDVKHSFSCYNGNMCSQAKLTKARNKPCDALPCPLRFIARHPASGLLPWSPAAFSVHLCVCVCVCVCVSDSTCVTVCVRAAEICQQLCPKLPTAEAANCASSGLQAARFSLPIPLPRRIGRPAALNYRLPSWSTNTKEGSTCTLTSCGGRVFPCMAISTVAAASSWPPPFAPWLP